MTTATPELSQPTRSDKPRYGIFGVGDFHDVWIMRSEKPLDWTYINRFTSRDNARAAVARYIDARNTAKQIGCRI